MQHCVGGTFSLFHPTLLEIVRARAEAVRWKNSRRQKEMKNMKNQDGLLTECDFTKGQQEGQMSEKVNKGDT